MRKIRLKKTVVPLTVILFIVISGFLFSCKGGEPGNQMETLLFTEEEPQSSAQLQTEVIYVYVCGAVMEPGVYMLPEGGRIFEVIDMAGGIAPDADLSAVNLADFVYDGQKVYVPAKGEEICQTSQGLININTADEALLMTLPGIGAARAAAIVAYRDANGRFESIEDIMNVSGIKESAYAKIKDLITVR